MSRFNKASQHVTLAEVKAARATSPISTKDSGKRVTNGLGATGYERKAKSELFLLAVSNFVGKDNFHEKAGVRDTRFVELVQKVALKDPDWFDDFVTWLRNDAFMRTASVVAAVEGAKALSDSRDYVNLGNRVNWGRRFVRNAQARADEPGEILGYWKATYPGKSIPAAIKKGVADGAIRLYNQYSLPKYDSEINAYRFGDVINTVRPVARDARQADLFKYALNRRYGNEEIPESLDTIRARKELLATPVEARKAIVRSEAGREQLAKAGITWEALSGWLQGPMDAAAWEAIIPQMGYMALLRNLSNFTEAGVSGTVMAKVRFKLASADEVAKSKQFPFRFLAAYQKMQGNLQISAALEEALEHSLSNVPSLGGNTLVLVDRSGSMFWENDGGELTRADKAAIFGGAIALRAENATLVEYGTSSRVVPFSKGNSLLPLVGKFSDMGGTRTVEALRAHFAGHDRVILVTDEQHSGGNVGSSIVPAEVPMYTWNLGGYRAAQYQSGSNRHTFGGLTDKGFQMIPLLEAGQNGDWPWNL